MTRANEVTGANAGGARRLQIRALWAARIAQFWRSAAKQACWRGRHPVR